MKDLGEPYYDAQHILASLEGGNDGGVGGHAALIMSQSVGVNASVGVSAEAAAQRQGMFIVRPTHTSYMHTHVGTSIHIHTHPCTSALTYLLPFRNHLDHIS